MLCQDIPDDCSPILIPPVLKPSHMHFIAILFLIWGVMPNCQGRLQDETPTTAQPERNALQPSLIICREESDAFLCDQTSGCIRREARCDGVPDCPDGKDELVSLCGCLSNEFYCNGTCIDKIRRCDTFPDCSDMTDEENCETYVCPPTHFKCDNHFCVPSDVVCDFHDHCGDHSDEHNCSFRKCWFGEYTCGNGQCIRHHSVCDGHLDCVDGSDEKLCDPKEHFRWCGNRQAHISLWCDDWPDCPDTHADELFCRNCTEWEFRCRNSRCISKAHVCDSICDCAGTCEDEEQCQHRYSLLSGIPVCDTSVTVLCPRTHRCIAGDYICNGRNDCGSGEGGADEHDCDIEPSKCLSMEHRFWCVDGRCLPSVVRCNHVVECLGGSDELNCRYPECGPGEFRCASGQCIDSSRKCNLLFDCQDKTDEIDCAWHICPKGLMQCGSGQCLPEAWWCDFHRDCPDGSDESHCDNSKSPCRPNELRCSNGQCIPSNRTCLMDGDGRSGCADGSHLIGCETWQCEKHQLKCSNSYCVDASLVCDGKVDCLRSWNDEEGCPFRCSSEKRCSCLDVTINCTGLGLLLLPQDIEHEILRLVLRSNRLGSVLRPGVFRGLERVTYLDLSANLIAAVPPESFASLWRLRILELADNLITTVEHNMFLGLGNLRSLILHGNKIRTLEPMAFSGLSSLKSLDLSHQNLVVIYRNAFLGLRSLVSLDLSFNFVTRLEDGIFNGLPQLIFLDISHNDVTIVAERVFPGLNSLHRLVTDEFRFCCLVPHVTDCLPEPDEFSSCADLMSNLVLRVCIWVLGVVALTGNSLVLTWRAIYKINNKVHSFLISNLAIADLLMGVYLLLIASVDSYYRGVYFIYESMWRQSELCQLAGFVSTLSSELSVLTLTVITLDRFVSIIFPFRLKRLEMRQTRWMMAVIWLAVVLLAATPLLKEDYFANFYGRSGVCLALHITPQRPPGWEYSVFVFLALNFLSFAVIAVAYFWMFMVARRTHRAVCASSSDNTMARRMMLIVLTDFCCWMPIILLGIISISGVYVPPQVFAWVAVFVLPLNAAVNPLLYTIATARFLDPTRTGVARLQVSFMQSTNGETQKTVIVSVHECNTRTDGHIDDGIVRCNTEIVPLRDLQRCKGTERRRSHCSTERQTSCSLGKNTTSEA